MNEFHKIVDEAIEEAIIPPKGTRGKKVYTIPTKHGPETSETDPHVADIVKSGDLGDVPYGVQATGPLEYSYSTDLPKPLEAHVKKDILSDVLGMSGRWFKEDDIKDAWNEFKRESKIKTTGVSVPTNADKEIMWNLFYDLMANKIKPLRTADLEAYNRLKSLKGKGLDKEILRPANRRLWAMVEGRKSWEREIKSGLRKLKKYVIEHVFPTITEDVEYGVNISNYSKILADAYTNADYEFPIIKDGENSVAIINLIENYGALKILDPGISSGESNSILKGITKADLDIFNATNAAISNIENNIVVKNTGWEFDRDGLKSAITLLDGTAPGVFKEQFIDLIEKLPHFGNTREEAEKIYNLLVFGHGQGEATAQIAREPERGERKPEEDPSLYPSIKREARPVSPEKLTARMPAYGEAEKIDRENLRDILRYIKDATDTYQESYYTNYEGTGKLASAGLLRTDPTRSREGVGAKSGINEKLQKIATGLGLSGISAGELKTSLLMDSNKLIPNMVLELSNKAKEIEKELVNPWVKSNFSSQGEEGIQSDADYMRSSSLPESYSRYFNVGRDPITIAYKKITSDDDDDDDDDYYDRKKKEEEREYKSEEEIMSLPGKTTDEKRKILGKFRLGEKEKETGKQLKSRADNLTSLFVELVKHEQKDSDPEVISQLKAMVIDEMSKLARGWTLPTTPLGDKELYPREVNVSSQIFSRMAAKLSSVDADSATKKSFLYKIADLIAEINDEIDQELAHKLVFASISNNDWEVLDLLTGIKEVGQAKKSVDGLIKAAVSIGDKGTISWAIDFINRLPSPPVVSLKNLYFEKSGEYSHKYSAFRKFGISEKMATIFALPKTNDMDQIKKIYNNELLDIIHSYGAEAMGKSRTKILQAKKANPKINSTPEAIARNAINNSGIKPGGSNDVIRILNPLGNAPESSQYAAIIKELIGASEPKSLNVFTHLQKFEEFKDIPHEWKADVSLNASVMVNKLQQTLGALIKELAGNLYNKMNIAKGKTLSAGDVMSKLPTQIRLQLRDYEIDEEVLDNIINHNTIVPIKRNPREDTNQISRDLVSSYNRLRDWKSKLEIKPSKEQEPEDIQPHKIADILSVTRGPRVSSETGGRIDIDKETSKAKQLKAEIESLETELKVSNLPVRDKQRQLDVISKKRYEYSSIMSIVNREQITKSQQEISLSAEIDKLIEARPHQEDEIRRLAKAGYSFGDIVELI